MYRLHSISHCATLSYSHLLLPLAIFTCHFHAFPKLQKKSSRSHNETHHILLPLQQMCASRPSPSICSLRCCSRTWPSAQARGVVTGRRPSTATATPSTPCDPSIRPTGARWSAPRAFSLRYPHTPRESRRSGGRPMIFCRHTLVSWPPREQRLPAVPPAERKRKWGPGRYTKLKLKPKTMPRQHRTQPVVVEIVYLFPICG